VTSGGILRRSPGDPTCPTLQVFRRDKPNGFWGDRGLLAKDVLAYISADLPDTEQTREWVKANTRTRLITRFQQDAIYLRWLSVETELVRPLERVTRSEIPGSSIQNSGRIRR